MTGTENLGKPSDLVSSSTGFCVKKRDQDHPLALTSTKDTIRQVANMAQSSSVIATLMSMASTSTLHFV